MKKRYEKFSLQLVKEDGAKYDSKMTNPYLAKKAFTDIFNIDNQAEEVFCLITVDTSTRISGAFEISRGSLDKAAVSMREVFKRALLANAKGIFVAHNHPSGDTSPSPEDKKITRRIKECCSILGITFLDHFIFGFDNENALSFKEEGLV